LVSILVDVMLLHPIAIWVKWLGTATVVDEEVRLYMNLLRMKYEHLLTRRSNAMSYNNFTQQFNPACRAARYYPHLPISSLLLSFNDFDISMDGFAPSRPLWFRLEFYICSLFLAFCWVWNTCPTVLQDLANEIVLTASLFGLVVLGSTATYQLLLMFVFALVIAVFIRELFKERWRRVHAVRVESHYSLVNAITTQDLEIKRLGRLEFIQYFSSKIFPLLQFRHLYKNQENQPQAVRTYDYRFDVDGNEMEEYQSSYGEATIEFGDNVEHFEKLLN